MKIEIIDWLKNIEKHDGTPPDSVIAFNLGLMESDQGYVMYFVKNCVCWNYVCVVLTLLVEDVFVL